MEATLAHRAVLAAILHAAATGQPLNPETPRRTAATIRASLEAAPGWETATPLRSDLVDTLADDLTYAIARIRHDDETARIIAQEQAVTS
jgi:hypothetical protein